MKTREEQLRELNLYVDNVNKDVTMILQTLQWDKKELFEGKCMKPCKYAANHKIPEEKLEQHEKECLMKLHGYHHSGTEMLPDPPNPDHNQSLVKLSANETEAIIEKACKIDPNFKRGPGCRSPQPLTLERLQATFTADERRAIHDAVVNAVPSCHDLSDLALLSTNGDEELGRKTKSRVEVLAELRDMKRRRTKYRVASKSSKYSDVLRDVIKSQMEIYTDVKIERAANQETFVKTETNETLHSTSYERSQSRLKLYERHDEYSSKRDRKTDNTGHFKEPRLRVEGNYSRREDKYDERREPRRRSRDRDSQQSSSKERYDRYNQYENEEYNDGDNKTKEKGIKKYDRNDEKKNDYKRLKKETASKDDSYERKKESSYYKRDYSDPMEAKRRHDNYRFSNDDCTRSESYDRHKHAEGNDVHRERKKHHKSKK